VWPGHIAARVCAVVNCSRSARSYRTWARFSPSRDCADRCADDSLFERCRDGELLELTARELRRDGELLARDHWARELRPDACSARSDREALSGLRSTRSSTCRGARAARRKLECALSGFPRSAALRRPWRRLPDDLRSLRSYIRDVPDHRRGRRRSYACSTQAASDMIVGDMDSAATARPLRRELVATPTATDTPGARPARAARLAHAVVPVPESEDAAMLIAARRSVADRRRRLAAQPGGVPRRDRKGLLELSHRLRIGEILVMPRESAGSTVRAAPRLMRACAPKAPASWASSSRARDTVR